MTLTSLRISALALFLAAFAFPAGGQQNVSPDDYRVYNAVLQQLEYPKADPYLVIAKTTQNRHCGAGSNLVLMQNCGLWFPPTTEDVIAANLRSNCPTFLTGTWTNFLKVSEGSSALEDRLQTKGSHEVLDLGDSAKKPAKKMDAMILFSNVGFNAGRDQALVFVLTLSYMESMPSTGQIFLLDLADQNHWKVAGRMEVYRLGG